MTYGWRWLEKQYQVKGAGFPQIGKPCSYQFLGSIQGAIRIFEPGTHPGQNIFNVVGQYLQGQCSGVGWTMSRKKFSLVPGIQHKAAVYRLSGQLIRSMKSRFPL